MKHLSPLLLALGARLARCVSLALLPALTSESVALSQPERAVARSVRSDVRATAFVRPQALPYLVAVMPAPLRFQEPLPVIDIVARASDSQFQREAELPGESQPAETESTTPAAGTEIAKTPEGTEPAAVKPATDSTATHKTGPASAPLPILPDDTPRNVTPEDVLPFFQFPGHPPVPHTPPPVGTLPHSSATYQQR